MKMEGQAHILNAGDVVAFPFGTGHQLGAGSGGRLILPTADLPPKPWREIPVLHYGNGPQKVRLLCGYLQCDALNFRPLRNALPTLLHVKTRTADNTAWFRATIDQIVAEVDRPRSGGLSMLERLTEISFIELLRHQIIAAHGQPAGWLAGLADPALGKCLASIHDDPARAWTVQNLSAASGVSRSTLTERFETMLDTSPMRYVRDWRLCLASLALSTTTKRIAAIAHEAGYGTEAAFNRAFSRTYGVPPAAWRQKAKRD
jgi:AraC-like DNA-binding protein